MPGLPEGLRAYRQTPVFDPTTVPGALCRAHRTKAGVWALIHVLEGQLLYRQLEPVSEEVLVPGTLGVIEPERPHEVEPLGAVRFYVEFYAAAPIEGSPHAQGNGGDTNNAGDKES